ncbi:MAG: aminotransferase class I/II-fold pyridoxal phosphate-dependent enzyme [Proteobacteria bacterium]|nr:aminotransferase class I/II-fold pyridoxal phosphate-dependent enzyme [Pseudomonadota bacterium]
MIIEPNLNLPLMKNNITRADMDAVIAYLSQDDPPLTHSKQTLAFEREWSEWLGVKYSVFVNSGASANLLTMAALNEMFGTGEVIVPPLTWVSDIAAVLQNGFTPVFVDIDRRTFGMDTAQVLTRLNASTRAVFITHILGYNALTQQLLDELERRNIPLIEDVCESHGATFNGRKLGTFGLISNFSFYYAHHMSTIEGGVICTNNRNVYETVRMLRSHGMVREATSNEIRNSYITNHPDLNPDFIFAFPAYNVRPNEIGAVIGRSQLKRLDENNRIRRRNLDLFLSLLDPTKYRTDFAVEGSCNYAFTLVLNEPDTVLRDRVEQSLQQRGVEFRRGLSGGGNQLRQPYLRKLMGNEFERYPNVNHIHFFGWYIGNYPGLEQEKIEALCQLLNRL